MRARRGHQLGDSVLAVLALAVLFMGIYPKPFTDVMMPAVTELLLHISVTKLP